MKRKFFAVFCVVLIILTCSLSAFADSFPNTSKGSLPTSAYTDILNDPAVAESYQRWLYIDSVSSIDFSTAWQVLEASGITLSWSTFDYNGISALSYECDIPVNMYSNFNISVLVQDTSNIYRVMHFNRNNSVPTDLTLKIVGLISERSSNALVYGGSWQLYATTGFTYTLGLPGPSGSSTVHLPSSNGFFIGYEFNEGTSIFFYSDSSLPLPKYLCTSFCILSAFTYDDSPIDYTRYRVLFSLFSPTIYANFNEYLVYNPYAPAPPADEDVSIASVMKDFVFSFFRAPVILLSSMLNFDVMGFNLFAVAQWLITALLVFFVVKFLVKLVLKIG